ncbi:hypothetical protein GGH92_002009 [Coemansia sp. RSA 2673]|nr:hypothetical protein GGH92_002009 [Coemansia sp. RSA 2673]
MADNNALIADQQRIIDQQGQTLTERDEKIAQLKRTISKQQHALDEQERMIARSSGHAHRIEHHLRQAVTIAGLIVEAPNGAATDNGAAPRNTNTDDDTRDGADPDDNDALDDADPNDDYVLDSDDAQENGNIQDNDDTQDSADPDDDDAPANQVTDSPPVAKRPRVDRQVRDDSEQVLANKDLLEVVGPIIFIDVDVLAGLYELVKNRQLIPAGVEARAFARRLEGLESFTRWKPRFSAVESATHTDLNVICRTAVVGPRLCYVLTTLDGLPPEKMTNSVMEKMFRMIVRKSLRTLRVVTRNGTRRMEIDELRNLAKVWINNICDLIAKEGIERSLELVTRCNNSYKRKCIERGAVDDLDGTVAMEMLVKDGLKSNLLLGLNHEHDLGALYTRFVPTAGNDNDESQADRL